MLGSVGVVGVSCRVDRGTAQVVNETVLAGPITVLLLNAKAGGKQLGRQNVVVDSYGRGKPAFTVLLDGKVLAFP